MSIQPGCLMPLLPILCYYKRDYAIITHLYPYPQTSPRR